MGGEGVWSTLEMAQNKFAAAIALCGYGDASMIPRAAKVPVWIFQGQADPVVNAESARLWVASLKQAGGTPKYTEYPGIGHAVWNVAFSEPELLPWLFSQRLKCD
jgi:predicted peptidase